MNKYGIIIGMVVAVAAAGSLSAYAILESDTELFAPDDIQDLVSDIKEDVSTDVGFGQVERNEGAYSP